MLLGNFRNFLKLLLLKNTPKVDPACLAVAVLPPSNLNEVNVHHLPNLDWVRLPFEHLNDWNNAVNQFTTGTRINTFKPIPMLVNLFVKTTLNQLNNQAHCDLVPLYNEYRENNQSSYQGMIALTPQITEKGRRLSTLLGLNNEQP